MQDTCSNRDMKSNMEKLMLNGAYIGNLPAIMGSHVDLKLNSLPTTYVQLQIMKHQQ